MSYEILHPEAFERIPILGGQYHDLLAQRVGEVQQDTVGVADPNVSVLIRTRNHAQCLEGLLGDLHRQEFGGNVQVVVVDTESSDGTADIARNHGAVVVGIEQSGFNYANSLNVGFEAADHPYVLTLVGHSRLSSDQTLRSVSRWVDHPEFAGAYGAALPNTYDTLGDAAISLLQGNKGRLAPAEQLQSWQGGAMVAHRSVVKKDAWAELGGYDEAYGNGGEDTDFARRMIARGMAVIREPGLSVHHSYGLGLTDAVRHINKLRKLRSAPPQEFVQGSVRHLLPGHAS